MATANGTATDYLDLLARLNTFLTGLTPAWTNLRSTSTEKIWSAPGGGSDAIIVGASAFFNAGADYYNWRLGGFTAFDSSLAFADQPGYVGGASQLHPSPVLNLWNSPIDYRFYGNSRRVIILAKVSTVQVCAYLGFISQYPSPGAFPYPLLVGGSMAWDGSTPEPLSTDARWRWSNSGEEARNFPIPRAVCANEWGSSMRLRTPSGKWIGFDRELLPIVAYIGKVWPYGNIGVSPDWRDNLGGGYSLLPIVLQDSTPNVYGELDGIYALTGFGNGAENTVTIGGVVHWVVQNVFRTDQVDYFAIKEA